MREHNVSPFADPCSAARTTSTSAESTRLAMLAPVSAVGLWPSMTAADGAAHRIVPSVSQRKVVMDGLVR
jgi:hypothetical protein